MTKQEIAQAHVDGLDFKGAISDGYHTFDELYDHRIRLFITVCKLHERELGNLVRVDQIDDEQYHDERPWISQLHSDGSSMPGWFVAGIGREDGDQMTYHLPMKYWEECSKVFEVLPNAPKWDGHTSADVLKRLFLHF